MALTRALIGALGAKATSTGDVTRFVFEIDGCWLDARMREAPVIEAYVRTVAIDGFELRLRPSGAAIPLDVRPRLIRVNKYEQYYQYDDEEIAAAIAAAATLVSVERHWAIEARGGDDAAALEDLLVDEPVRAALRDALWLRRDDGVLGVSAAVESYELLHARGEVMVRRRDELDVERLLGAFRAGALLAARPHRIARAWLDVARALGGTTTGDRWDLGGFAATVERGATTIRIDSVRTLPGEDPDDARLRTRARARRLAPEPERWAWWRDHVDKAHRPRPRRRALDTLAPRDAELVRAAAVDALIVDGDEVTAWWRGDVRDLPRLGPAIELLARLAAPSGAASGPYR